MGKRLGAAVAALFAAWCAGAAAVEAATAADLFDPALARPPYIGEWVEYLVCHPVDPLENSLSPTPLPAPGEQAAAEEYAEEEGEYILFEPRFEPPTAWRRTPLRLEIIQVDENGCRAVMRLGNLRREVSLPNRRGGGEAEFVYDAPQPEDETRTVAIGDDEFACALTRRDGGGYGFARLSHRDLPFGLARFATRDVDVILVGRGTGLPPDFPLRTRQRIEPEPGLFFEAAAF